MEEKKYSAAGMERILKIQEVIAKAMAGKLTWWEAAEIMGVTDRTMRRWRGRIEKNGYSSLYDRRKHPIGSEVFGIACNLAERFGDATEQQAVEFGLILQNERVQFMWQGEDDVKITGLKQFLLPRVDPSVTRLSLALVAVTIATTVV